MGSDDRTRWGSRVADLLTRFVDMHDVHLNPESDSGSIQSSRIQLDGWGWLMQTSNTLNLSSITSNSAGFSISAIVVSLRLCPDRRIFRI